jgi:hypothetical protein
MTSIIKVDNLQNQCGANIISESANVITIGASGDTVTLAAGASQSGFGRSGSVNWDTTPKTTSPVTAVSGNGYFINTTSGAITVNLPSTPAAGDIVAIADYANTSATNNITVGRNGSNIDGSAIDAKIKVNGQVYTLVYVDATEGWKTVGQTFNQISTTEFVTATGGTITTCGNYKIHTFTGPGTFCVSNAGNPGGSTSVDYLVVAGGGGSGRDNGGGGGAGGFRYSNSTFPVACAPGSPLASATALPVSATGYPITVGAGGGICTPAFIGIKGNDSIFSTITSTGGGFGVGCASNTPAPISGNGQPGGSGGGAGQTESPTTRSGGTGNSPPVSPPQGNNGGSTSSISNGGAAGGAAMATGSTCGPKVGGVGAGLPTAFGSNGVPSGGYRYYAGGGGGGGPQGSGPGGAGGLGGGGAGGGGSCTAGTPGTANTGGGAGGGSQAGNGGTGGSGIVVIRYKFQ